MSDKTPTDEMIRTLQSLEAEWTRAGRSMAAVMPKEMAGAFNLMAHPAAAIAASTVVSMGVMSQAMALWMGAWTGTASTAKRAASGPSVATSDETKEAAASAVATRTKATADTLMSDARSLADEVVAPVVAKAPVALRAKPMAPAKRRNVASARKFVAAEEQTAKPVARAKPANPDDLKAISGVGPKLEQVLNGLGIWTYAQIVALTPAEIGWIEDYLAFKGRIARDGWLEQAARLGAGEKQGGSGISGND